MKKLFALIISVMALTGCNLDDNPLYYKLPDITNVAYTPELESITANDEVAVSATVINYYGVGYACVKYWVCDNTWGEQMPELKIDADVLYCWVEPQAEGEQGRELLHGILRMAAGKPAADAARKSRPLFFIGNKDSRKRRQSMLL